MKTVPMPTELPGMGKNRGVGEMRGFIPYYATKTISTGEGGMLVSANEDLIKSSNAYRDYGKFNFEVEGLNYRMNEFTAALGCIQTDRLDKFSIGKINTHKLI